MKYFKLTYLLPLLLTFFSLFSGYAQTPRINEVCASNITVLMDENQDYPDWIELYNPGTEIINLQGYGLSDSPDTLMKWTFPAYSMNPGSFLVVFASGKQIITSPGFWNGVFTQGDSWKYIIPQSELPASWKSISYDDNAWLSGNTGIGYGDGDDETNVPDGTISVFARKTFSLSNIDSISKLILSIDYDDAFVAYLNGTEICRDNIGTPGTPPAFNATADVYIEPSMATGGRPAEYDITNFLPLLVEGENIIAVQVHNQSSGSSDLTFIPFLSYKSSFKAFPDPDPLLGFSSSSFHTNFKLDKDGDSLFISNPAGNLLQLFQIDYNSPDVSLGFPDDAGDVIKAFPIPTPWLSNTTEAFNFNKPSDFTISPTAGYYGNSFNITMSTSNPDDNIYYTTDGSVPTTSSQKYTGPISMPGDYTIKARIINPGYLPGEIKASSYYHKYSNGLPVVFISTNPENLWDTQTGIYVLGDSYTNTNPYFGANFWEDWERPAYVEYFTPDGSPGFAVNAGIKIFGGWSRAHPAKSLSIFARNEYGDRNISYKIFENKEIDKFEAIVLRNSGNEWFGQNSQAGVLFRDLLMTRLAGENNVDFQAGRPVTVFLNGEYWGIHNLREKINEHFVSSNHSNINPDRVNLLIGNKSVIQGSNFDYVALENFVNSNSMLNQDNYEYIQTKMDMRNFIDYEVAQIFYFNGDWPGNNIKFWKFDAPYSKWRWIIYDTDFGMGLWDINKAYYNSLDFATTQYGPDWPNPAWSTFLLRNLLKNPDFKTQFINTFADRLNTVFSSENLVEAIDYHYNLIEPEINDHIGKWGGNYNNWDANVEAMRNFANLRPMAMRNIIRNFFSINVNRSVRFSTTGAPDAKINLNTLILDEFPWTGIYFDNIPVKIRAIAPDGYRFVRWDGSVQSSEQEIVLDMKANKEITAVFEPYVKGEFEGVIINEISYTNLIGSGDWVELYNNSSETKDISGWILKDSDEGHEFKIAKNTLLLPHDYLVIVKDQEQFFNAHHGVSNYTGNTGFGLNRTGECIRLYDSQRKGIDSVCYATEYPWPSSSLTTGGSIALRDPNSNNNIGFNWSSSINFTATPGTTNLFTGTVEFTAPLADAGTLLYQNYPNPFSGETKILFKLAKDSNIRISIYNLNGQLVEELADEFFPEGIHEVRWNSGNNLPGVYILNLKDSQNSYQKRMLISK